MIQQSVDDFLSCLFQELNQREDYIIDSNTQKIALISTPRSGSSLFCDLLQKSNQLGEPREWINLRYIAAYAKLTGTGEVNIRDYIDFIIQKTTTKNGFFSINFHVSQYTELKNKGIDIFALNFDKIYYIYREDKLAQAYSLAKANLTDQWSSTNLVNSQSGDLTISNHQVIRSLLEIVSSEDYYHQHLENRCNMAFSYEDFSRLDGTEAFERLFYDLGIDFNLHPESILKRQSNEADKLNIEKLKNYLLGTK